MPAPTRLSGRSVALVATLCLMAGTAAAVDAAHAAGLPAAKVCVGRVEVVESPGGATVAVLHRGDVVRVLRRSADGRWRRVATPVRTRGWLPAKALCGASS